MSIKTLFAAAAVSLAAFPPAEAAVVHIVGNGKLAGATGVVVDGSIYDVTFEDGACDTVFTDCGALPDYGPVPFAFTTEAGALAAAQALLDQVFINDVSVGGVTYNFDSQPTLTHGCTRTYQPQVDHCFIPTPYHISGDKVLEATVINYEDDAKDVLELQFDFTHIPTYEWNVVYAKWRPANPAPVPLPAGLPLLLTGFAGLAGLRVTGKRRG